VSEHVVCNPTSEEKLARLVELLRLSANAQVVEQVERAKAAYLRWGRDTLGWAIYMFRRSSVCSWK
jgi:hypothetical protein